MALRARGLAEGMGPGACMLRSKPAQHTTPSHAPQELYGAERTSLLTASLSRLLTGFLQKHGFTCGMSDVLLVQVSVRGSAGQRCAEGGAGTSDEERRWDGGSVELPCRPPTPTRPPLPLTFLASSSRTQDAEEERKKLLTSADVRCLDAAASLFGPSRAGPLAEQGMSYVSAEGWDTGTLVVGCPPSTQHAWQCWQHDDGAAPGPLLHVSPPPWLTGGGLPQRGARCEGAAARQVPLQPGDWCPAGHEVLQCVWVQWSGKDLGLGQRRLYERVLGISSADMQACESCPFPTRSRLPDHPNPPFSTFPPPPFQARCTRYPATWSGRACPAARKRPSGTT